VLSFCSKEGHQHHVKDVCASFQTVPGGTELSSPHFITLGSKPTFLVHHRLPLRPLSVLAMASTGLGLPIINPDLLTLSAEERCRSHDRHVYRMYQFCIPTASGDPDLTHFSLGNNDLHSMCNLQSHKNTSKSQYKSVEMKNVLFFSTPELVLANGLKRDQLTSFP